MTNTETIWPQKVLNAYYFYTFFLRYMGWTHFTQLSPQESLIQGAQGTNHLPLAHLDYTCMPHKATLHLGCSQPTTEHISDNWMRLFLYFGMAKTSQNCTEVWGSTSPLFPLSLHRYLISLTVWKLSLSSQAFPVNLFCTQLHCGVCYSEHETDTPRHASCSTEINNYFHQKLWRVKIFHGTLFWDKRVKNSFEV